MSPRDGFRWPSKLQNIDSMWSDYVRQPSARLFNGGSRKKEFISDNSEDQRGAIRRYPIQSSRYRSGFSAIGQQTNFVYITSTSQSKSRRRSKFFNFFRRNPSDRATDYSQSRPSYKSRLYLSQPRIRFAFLTCCISGLLVVALLSLYLILAFSKQYQSRELHILLIVIILITTIFFCHTLIRVCILILQLQDVDRQISTSNEITEASVFPDTVIPISATMARDEELTEIDDESIQVPPPAYGIWRESVWMDPNQIFWHNVENSPRPTRSTSTARPPSYLLDEGLSYLANAIATRPTSRS